MAARIALTEDGNVCPDAFEIRIDPQLRHDHVVFDTTVRLIPNNIDHSHSVATRGSILQSKPMLRSLYREWYSDIAEAVPDLPGRVMELGSGGGFLAEHVADLISTDVLVYRGLDVCTDALRLPVGDEKLRAILMINVLHHIPEPSQFFAEASRSLVNGGVVSMIEPWVTPWSRWIYRLVGHEPFDPNAEQWSFESLGPMSSSNQALPWVILERDRLIFETEFPSLNVVKLRPQTPFRYIVSGGYSFPRLAPAFSHSFWRAFEDRLQPWIDSMAMFAHIVIRKGQ